LLLSISTLLNIIIFVKQGENFIFIISVFSVVQDQ